MTTTPDDIQKTAGACSHEIRRALMSARHVDAIIARALLAERERCAAEIADLKADNERLRVALKPFGASQVCDDLRFHDTHPAMLALGGSWEYDIDECEFTLGDFRRARLALEGK
jgi:hypothetical protein